MLVCWLIIHAGVHLSAGHVHSMQNLPSAAVEETQQSDLGVTFAVSTGCGMTQSGGWRAVAVSAAAAAAAVHTHTN